MKEHFKRIWYRLDAFSLVIGLAFGFAIAMSLFSYLVPSGGEIIKYYRYENRQQFNEANE
jgi:hypothetical protein